MKTACLVALLFGVASSAFAQEENSGLLPSTPDTVVEDKRLDTDGQDHELQDDANQEDIDSSEERALGGKKRGGGYVVPMKKMPAPKLGGKKRGGGYVVPMKKMPAPKKVIAAPKKIAAPIYSGKKGGFYGGGYYRRLGEQEESSEQEETESED
ncbi:hypothetical protein CSUI_010508, partial [Cystoisospora suis]